MRLASLNQNSNLDLFEILFRQYYDKLFRVAYSITRNKELSKDAVQQAFFQAYKKMNHLKDKSKFPAWVTTITVNEARNMVKSAIRHKVVPISDEIQMAIEAGSFEHAYIIKDQVTRVLNLLSVDDSEILVLRYYSDLTLEEIASILNITLSNAKVCLHRAKVNFKEIMSIHDADDMQLGGITQ
ncbi:MAG: sigma-70 family RNA polymerase sigma factor [Desulfitobacteriaceae bacterium]